MNIQPLKQEDFAMEIIKDLGMQYSAGNSERRRRRAIFKCSKCNLEFETDVAQAKNSKMKTGICCRKVTHGGVHSKLYSRYKSMISRCHGKPSKSSINYGDIGVSVCKEWRDSFEAFRDWALEAGYTDATHANFDIDKDILSEDLGIHPHVYSPETCQFVARTINSAARRKRSDNTSGYIGVEQVSKNSHKAEITVNKKTIRVGSFKTAILAAQARNDYIIKHELCNTLNVI